MKQHNNRSRCSGRPPDDPANPRLLSLQLEGARMMSHGADKLHKLQTELWQVGVKALAGLMAFFGFCTPFVAASLAPTRTVGLYHWGGKYTRSMSEGVEQIESLGGRI